MNILQWLFKKPKRIEYKVSLPIKPESVIHVTKADLTSFGLPGNLIEGGKVKYDIENSPWFSGSNLIPPIDIYEFGKMQIGEGGFHLVDKINDCISVLNKQREP